MQLDTDAWCTAAEAARLLGVSPQRVNDMVNEDGLLDVIRPWDRVTLVSRHSLAEWLAGVRPPRIMRKDAREWACKQTGVDDLAALDREHVRDLMRQFIAAARPRWDAQRCDLWALNVASRELGLDEEAS